MAPPGPSQALLWLCFGCAAVWEASQVLKGPAAQVPEAAGAAVSTGVSWRSLVWVGLSCIALGLGLGVWVLYKLRTLLVVPTSVTDVRVATEVNVAREADLDFHAGYSRHGFGSGTTRKAFPRRGGGRIELPGSGN